MSDEQIDFAPATYQSAWQFGEGDTAKLLTAEDWLEEEADVDERVPPPPGDTGPSRAGIMRAIAAEIRELRRERTMWADECTRRAHG